MRQQTNPFAPLYDLLIECCQYKLNNKKLEQYASNIIDWNGFLDAAYAHGIYPLIAKSLKNITTVPKDIKTKLKITNLDIAKRNMMMTTELLKVMTLLEEDGIKAIAIKGPVLSQIIYGDITQRQFSDLDLLIHENDLYRATYMLTKNGYTFEHSIDFTKNSGLLIATKDILLKRKDLGINLELHWRLFSGHLFKKSNINLFRDNKKNILINQEHITTLDNKVLLLYLLLHGSKHMWERLEWIVDIDRLVRTQKIDWEIIYRYSKIMQIEPMIELGFSTVFNLFSTPFPKKTIQSFLQKNAIKNAQLIVKNNLFSNKIFKEGRIMNTIYYLGLGKNSQLWYEYILRFLRYTKTDVYTINLPNTLTPLYHLVHLYNSGYYRFKKILCKAESND